MKKLFIITGLLLSLSATEAFAATGGSGWAFGGVLGLTFANQDGMNTLIKRANTREGGISTSEMNSAYELAGFIEYRFGLLAMHFRPSFFYQKEDGSKAGGGDFNYMITGYTFFPMLRIYMLENAFIKAFSQFGIGFGMVDGSIEEENDAGTGQAKVEFSSFNTGYVFGLGFEFCLISANHCFSVEGNYRFLNFSRVVADSGTGGFDDDSGGPNDSLSQGNKGQEIELDANDLEAKLGGVQGLIGYAYHF